MYYSVIRPYDIANGPGVRVSLWVSGCRNRCPGCFNPQTWNFDYGQEFTWDTLHEIEELLKSPHVSGLSILGGDPFEIENREWVETLCAYIQHNCPGKSIWCWTGYLWEDLCDLSVMKHINVLIDGKFEEDKKDLRLKYCGSSNQRVIDIPASRRAGEVVLWEPGK